MIQIIYLVDKLRFIQVDTCYRLNTFIKKISSNVLNFEFMITFFLSQITHKRCLNIYFTFEKRLAQSLVDTTYYRLNTFIKKISSNVLNFEFMITFFLSQKTHKRCLNIYFTFEKRLAQSSSPSFACFVTIQFNKKLIVKHKVIQHNQAQCLYCEIVHLDTHLYPYFSIQFLVIVIVFFFLH